MNIETRDMAHFSEISLPPYAYVMTLGTRPPNERLVEISGFADYGYGELPSVSRRLAVLQTYMPMPGDYRPYSQPDSS